MVFTYDLEKVKKHIEENKSIYVRTGPQSVEEVKSDGFEVKEDGIHLGEAYIFKPEQYGYMWYLTYSEFSDDLNEWYSRQGSLD